MYNDPTIGLTIRNPFVVAVVCDNRVLSVRLALTEDSARRIFRSVIRETYGHRAEYEDWDAVNWTEVFEDGIWTIDAHTVVQVVPLS